MKLIRFLKKVFYLFIVWVVIHSVIICIDGLTNTKHSADLAVILGTKVNEDGTLSERLEKRLDAGINLYKSERAKKLFVSGGLGKEGHWEGDKMKEYLIKNGVNAADTYVDNYGNNSRLTVQYTLYLKKQLDFNSVIIVSQYFHLTRTKMLFRKKGLKKVYSVSAEYFEWRDIYSIPREFFAFYSQLF